MTTTVRFSANSLRRKRKGQDKDVCKLQAPARLFEIPASMKAQTAAKEKRISGKHRGLAPAIRKMKTRFPEMSEVQIAERVNCSPANVHCVLKTFLGDRTVENLRDFQENKADIYDSLQQRFLESITKEDIEKAPLNARVWSGAVLEDKARTIRGQATSVNVTIMADLVEMIKEMRK